MISSYTPLHSPVESERPQRGHREATERTKCQVRGYTRFSLSVDDVHTKSKVNQQKIRILSKY